LLDLVVGPLGAGAQAHGDAAESTDDLLRHVHAEGADHGPPGGFVVLQFLDAQAVDLTHHEVEVGHALRTVTLAEVGVGVELWDRRQQEVVGLEIETEVGPHGAVVDGSVAHGRPFAGCGTRGEPR